MAFNMGHTLFCMLVLIIIPRTMTEEHNMSSENINDILDKLIKQTKPNESMQIADVTASYSPVSEKHHGNDSNIYVFKTLMAPQIDFKSSSEIFNRSRHSHDDAHGDFPPTSDEVQLSTASIVNRKKIMGVDDQTQHDTPTKRRSGMADENEHELEDLITKEMYSSFHTGKENLHSFFSKPEQQSDQLKLLQKYPEIIIDHVSYDDDDDDNDKNSKIKIKPADEAITTKKEVIIEIESQEHNTKPVKTRFSIPEEDIVTKENKAPDEIESRKYSTLEVKSLIDEIQKKLLHDSLLKQTSENNFLKQNMLIERIMQRLPVKQPIRNNAMALPSYMIHHERSAPIAIDRRSHLHGSVETLHRHVGNRHVKKTYLQVPPVTNKWKIHNRVLRTLLRLCRSGAIKRTRLIASLIDKIMSNIDYRSVCYDYIYKK
ncbi:hypothetical protein B5X24_HaOG213052 [Helicoverpa armigera]|nr:hypothetical protein B5X24_HaOG213052 [Helicoverpa armigera]